MVQVRAGPFLRDGGHVLQVCDVVAAPLPSSVQKGQAHGYHRLQWYFAPVLTGNQCGNRTEPRLNLDHCQIMLARQLEGSPHPWTELNAKSGWNAHERCRAHVGR